MAEFPRREPDIEMLADTLASGLENHADEFPSPPVAPTQLEASLEAFRAARFKARDASAAARLATKEKWEARRKLVAELKADIRYAENTCGYKHATLKTLGWGGRRPKKPMEAPGQVVGFKILKEGPGWIEFSWDKPIDGGEVRAYRIERCAFDGEQWEIAGMSTATKAKLENQERGVDWMYRAIAVNAVGEGPYSANAEAVL